MMLHSQGGWQGMHRHIGSGLLPCQDRHAGRLNHISRSGNWCQICLCRAQTTGIGKSHNLNANHRQVSGQQRLLGANSSAATMHRQSIPNIPRISWANALLLSLLSFHGWFSNAQEVHPYNYLESQVNSPSYTVTEKWASHQHLPNWDVVKAAAADTWDELPQQFDPEYKNPCWTTQDGVLKCLPYFQILGVSKCGTTDLYHRLTFHPDFVECSWKGPHFWDESSYPSSRPKDTTKYDGSFAAYVRIFNDAAKKISQDKSARVTGEASSNTFTGVAAYLRGMTLAKRINATTAEYLWEAAPWSRFIILFRDPVRRYYSAYYYYRSRALGPGTPQEFHDRAATEIKQWQECVQKDGEHSCLKQYRPQQLVKGLYATFIPYWTTIWPRQQLLFMRNEDYKAAPTQHVQAAADFLGLRRTEKEWLSGAEKMGRRNEKRYESMLSETEKMLQDFYRPYNQRLVELMGGDKRWTWGY